MVKIRPGQWTSEVGGFGNPPCWSWTTPYHRGLLWASSSSAPLQASSFSECENPGLRSPGEVLIGLTLTPYLLSQQRRRTGGLANLAASYRKRSDSEALVDAKLLDGPQSTFTPPVTISGGRLRRKDWEVELWVPFRLLQVSALSTQPRVRDFLMKCFLHPNNRLYCDVSHRTHCMQSTFLSVPI